MDLKDRKIIEALKKDARLPIREIAKETQLKPSTVHIRLKRLIKEKIIEKFTVKLNNEAIEESFIVFIYVSTREDLSPSFFKSKYLKEAFGITGEYDLLIKLKFKDIVEFNEYMTNLRKNKAITKTITNVVTANIKEELH